MMTVAELQELKEELRRLVVKDVGAALRRLREALPAEAPRQQEVLSLEGRLNEANLARVRGVIGQEDLQLTNNRIREALILLITDLRPADFEASAGSPLPAGKTGSILYQIPGRMRLGEAFRCIVRLAFEEASIIRNIEITEETRLQSVRISEVMDVALLDPNPEATFEIRSPSSAEQFVERGDYTEWTFYVRPLREGSYPLLLKVAVIELVMGKERKKEIVLEETVQITTAAAEPVEEAGAGFKAAGYQLAFAGAQPPPFVEAPSPGYEPLSPDRPAARRPSLRRTLMVAASFLLVATVAVSVYFNIGAPSGETVTNQRPAVDVEEPAGPAEPIVPAPADSFTVRVLLDPAWPPEGLLVDGAPATVTGKEDSFLLLRVPVRETPVRFTLPALDCEQAVRIAEDGQVVRMSCAE